MIEHRKKQNDEKKTGKREIHNAKRKEAAATAAARFPVIRVLPLVAFTTARPPPHTHNPNTQLFLFVFSWLVNFYFGYDPISGFKVQMRRAA